MFRRLIKSLGIAGLSLLLMIAVSCDNSSPNSGSDGGNDNSLQVFAVDLSLGDDGTLGEVSNYYGATDTIIVTGRAVNRQNVGVSGAKIDFSVIDGLGSIIDADTATNSSGESKAKLIITHTLEDMPSTVVRATVESVAKMDEKTLEVSTKSVFITVTAAPTMVKVEEGGNGSSQLTVKVRDDQGVLVGNIPVGLRRVKGSQNSVITPVHKTNAIGAENEGKALSTLSLDNITEVDTIEVEAFINIPNVAPATMSKSESGLSQRIRNIVGKDNNVSTSNLTSVTTDIVTVIMRPLEENIANVNMWIDPSIVSIPENSSQTFNISIVASDANQNGIEGVQFELSIENAEGSEGPTGVLSVPSLTDGNGLATAQLFSNRNFGTWNITATAGNQEVEAQVQVIPLPPASGNLALTANAVETYSDNGVTTVDFFATLTNEHGAGIAGETVAFAVDAYTDGERYGTITASVVTDENGVAIATFRDRGLQLPIDPETQQQVDFIDVNVRAFHQALSAEDSHTIRLLPARQIGALEFTTIIPSDMNAAVFVPWTPENTPGTMIKLRVNYLAGGYAEPGTTVEFGINSGNTNAAIYQNTVVTDDNGVATTYFQPGTRAGTVVIQARTFDETIGDDGAYVYSSEETVQIKALTPKQFVFMSLDPAQLYTNQPDPAIFRIAVHDSLDNRVEANHSINFTSSIGIVTPTASTDAEGIVQGSFTPGTQAGIAWIKYSYGVNVQDSVAVMIMSSNPQSMVVESDVLELSAAGTGGNETAQITAHVYDPFGNPVQSSTDVHFRLEMSPEGCRLGDSQPSSDTYQPEVVAATSNGVAQVAINSGIKTGLIRLSAWVDLGEGQLITAFMQDLQVVAGPPANIMIGFNEDVRDGGGNVWIANVTALITDEVLNPVADDIAVSFEVTDGDASITNGYTGNEPAVGEEGSAVGVAYAALEYLSESVNTLVTIEASVVGGDGEVLRQTRRDINLPIQDAYGNLSVDPINFLYLDLDPDAMAKFQCDFKLYDGHDYPINGQEIRYLTTRGFFYRTNLVANTPTNEAVTGPMDINGQPDPGLPDDNGECMRWLWIRFQEAFPDPRIMEATAQVDVNVLDTQDYNVEPVTINLAHIP